MKPDISIIIPAYNADRWIRDCIDSCLAQSGVKAEIIVVNDGSTDGTGEVLKEYGDKIRVIEQENGGAARARNVGIRAAAGEYIKVVDADDYLFPGCLAPQLEHARSLDERTISYGRMYCHSSLTGRIYPWSQRDDREVVNDGIGELIYRDPLHVLMLWPRSIFNELSGYDQTLRNGEDRDLYFRSVVHGWMFRACHYPVYVYRHHISDGRLSSDNNINDRRLFADRFEQLPSLLEACPQHAERSAVTIGLAKYAWASGRSSLHLGFADEAQRFFSLSRALASDAGVVGRWPYRVLVKALGPLRAEHVSKIIKTVIGRA